MRSSPLNPSDRIIIQMGVNRKVTYSSHQTDCLFKMSLFFPRPRCWISNLVNISFDNTKPPSHISHDWAFVRSIADWCYKFKANDNYHNRGFVSCRRLVQEVAAFIIHLFTCRPTEVCNRSHFKTLFDRHRSPTPTKLSLIFGCDRLFMLKNKLPEITMRWCD